MYEIYSADIDEILGILEHRGRVGGVGGIWLRDKNGIDGDENDNGEREKCGTVILGEVPLFASLL